MSDPIVPEAKTYLTRAMKTMIWMRRMMAVACVANILIAGWMGYLAITQPNDKLVHWMLAILNLLVLANAFTTVTRTGVSISRSKNILRQLKDIEKEDEVRKLVESAFKEK